MKCELATDQVRLDMLKGSGGGINDEANLVVSPSEQFLLLSHTDNADAKTIRITNNPTAGGSIVYDNNVDTNPLTISSVNTGVSITAEQDLTATSIQSVITNVGVDLVFNGASIESGTSGGNSGQHLRIKLNGVYYKIALQDD
jgi:hypothetical protein